MTQVITKNASGIAPYIFDDAKEITMEAGRIVIGPLANPEFYIGDMNSGNATLHTGAPPAPVNWEGNSTTYDGTDHIPVPGYERRAVREIAELQTKLAAAIARGDA